MTYEPLIGTEVHGYRIEHKLGEGGMGKVFRAHHHGIGRWAVVKTLVPAYANHEALRERFVREARIVASLDHPNVITVENFGQLPSGELFMIMPLLQGRPLDEVLQTAGKLGPHHTLSIVAQIASALHHAHAHGVIHRDLKPGNVFLERKGNQDVVKVLDFGIAKDAQSGLVDSKAKTRTGSAMGTPHYMAVEQHDDAASVTPAADIFALAVMIVEMLTGQLPWGVESDAVLYYKQRTEPPTLGPEIPRAWIPALLAALSPHPARRPSSARSFIVALANELPAHPPLWGSGAKIVKDVAPGLIIEALPQDETVKARGNAPMSSIPVYPSVATPPSNANWQPNQQPSAPAPSMPPTANERPMQPATTLSGSNGATAPPPVGATRRGAMLAAIGLGTAGVAAVVAFAIGRVGASRSTPIGGNDRAIEHAATMDASAPMPTPLQSSDVRAVLPVDAAVAPISPAPDASVTQVVTPSSASVPTKPAPPKRATTTRPPARANGSASTSRDTIDRDDLVE